MKKLSRAIVTIFASTCWTSVGLSQEYFSLDLAPGDVTRATAGEEGFIVADLAVGDTGKIDEEYVCHQDSRLVVDAAAPLRTDSGIYWHIRRLPGQSVEVEILDKGAQPKSEVLQEEIRSVLTWMNCESYGGTWLNDIDSGFTVKSVNGHSSLSSLLGSLENTVEQ